MKVTIKPASYTLSKTSIQACPVVWLTDMKPNSDTLEFLKPTSNPRICFIPYAGWTAELLNTMFRWVRNQYESHSIHRQNVSIGMAQILNASGTSDIREFLDDRENASELEVLNSSIDIIRKSIEENISNRETNPIVELVPWRYCRFLFYTGTNEAWLDLDGTFIIPIMGRPDAKQKMYIERIIRPYYFHVLKEQGIYSTESKPVITIGLDPEVSVYRRVSGKGRINEHVTAREVIGQRNCDAKVGTDGCDSIFEFRPNASTDIDAVVSSVEDCVRGLAFKLARFGLQNVQGIAGGGCSHSLGGHIHIGNERIKKLNQQDLKQFGKMMDDFLYFPIRDRMTGAIRQWVNLPSVSQQSFVGPLPNFDNIDDAKESLKSIERFSRSIRFAGYDNPSQWRQKMYGYEYRSLPSFIVNKEFTKCVLEMTQIMATKFWHLCTDGSEFEYSTPCKMKDYLLLFPKELATTFHHYINGDKRDIFMDDIFKSWGVENNVYEKYVNVQKICVGPHGIGERACRDEDDLTDISATISKRFHSLLRYVYKDGNLPGRILFMPMSSGNALFSIHNRGFVVHRQNGNGCGADYNALASFPTASVIFYGTALRKGGFIHCVKQALIMDVYNKVGRSAPRRFERMAKLIRQWCPETENSYGELITSDFTPLNRG